MATGEAIRSDLERDPASLASQAAVELDDLVRGRSTGIDAVRRLAEIIRGEFSTKNAPTVGVMNRAIQAANLLPSPQAKVSQVVKQAAQVARKLEDIANNPSESVQNNRSDVESMRRFCVEYSMQKSMSKHPRKNSPKHPYRKSR